MAKDPAFLFYPGDWISGTMLLSRHLKGCYFDLLMAQFNNGPLSLDQIKTVLGQDQAAWTVLQEKFKKDNSGRFFNERLATEQEKRKSYVSSLGNRGQGRKKSIEETKENQLFNHTENRNKDESKDLNPVGGSGGNDTRGGIVIYLPEQFLEETEGTRWLEEAAMLYKLNPGWCLDRLRQFAAEQKLKGGYGRPLAKIKDHFINTIKKEIKNNDSKKNIGDRTQAGGFGSL